MNLIIRLSQNINPADRHDDRFTTLNKKKNTDFTNSEMHKKTSEMHIL